MTVGLLRHLHHVVDRLLDEVVGDVGATALRGHGSGAAGETVDRVVVEHRLALRYPRCPGGFIACAGRSGDSLSMARTAGLLEELGAVLRNRDLRRAGGSGTRRLDGKRGVVVPRDRLLSGGG